MIHDVNINTIQKNICHRNFIFELASKSVVWFIFNRLKNSTFAVFQLMKCLEYFNYFTSCDPRKSESFENDEKVGNFSLYIIYIV